MFKIRERQEIKTENSSEMSDDERYYREMDLESMIDDDSEDRKWKIDEHGVNEAERRAHHNALERKRRDHIKDSFINLRDAVPSLHGEKVQASRAQILKKAADYIQLMRKRQTSHLQDIDDLKRQNNLLEAQIRMLEKSRPFANNYLRGDVGRDGDDDDDVGEDASSSDSESELQVDDQPMSKVDVEFSL